jgi:hypothetical protein
VEKSCTDIGIGAAERGVQRRLVGVMITLTKCVVFKKASLQEQRDGTKKFP